MVKILFLVNNSQKGRHGCVKSEHVLWAHIHTHMKNKPHTHANFHTLKYTHGHGHKIHTYSPNFTYPRGILLGCHKRWRKKNNYLKPLSLLCVITYFYPQHQMSICCFPEGCFMIHGSRNVHITVKIGEIYKRSKT